MTLLHGALIDHDPQLSCCLLVSAVRSSVVRVVVLLLVLARPAFFVVREVRVEVPGRAARQHSRVHEYKHSRVHTSGRIGEEVSP